eukprot:3271019-Pyramimonas_sp.AAC.1
MPPGASNARPRAPRPRAPASLPRPHRATNSPAPTVASLEQKPPSVVSLWLQHPFHTRQGLVAVVNLSRGQPHMGSSSRSLSCA